MDNKQAIDAAMIKTPHSQLSSAQQLKKVTLKLILTKVLDLILTKTNTKMLQNLQSEIIDRKFYIIWPQVYELDIPLEILKDVESSLFKDLLRKFGNIEFLKTRFFITSIDNEKELTKAIKDFLKQSTLQTYANRASHFFKNNWHVMAGVACVTLPLTWLLTTNVIELELKY